MNINKYRLQDKKVYLIIDINQFETTDKLLDYVANALNNGIKMLQISAKNTNSREFINIGKKIRELCSIYEALFIVNDRIDIAQIIEADGIHLEEDGIDYHSAKELVNENMIIGLSIKTHEEAIHAQNHKVDYINITNNSKDFLDWIEQNIEIPCFINKTILNYNELKNLENTTNRLYITNFIN